MEAKTPKQHLDEFLKALMAEEALVEDVVKLLTKTQQDAAKFIGGITPSANLNGLHSVLKQAKSWSTKEKINTNPVMKDCIIKMIGINGKTVKMQCRLIKEVTPMKTGEDGEWGVNASSFKFLDK